MNTEQIARAFSGHRFEEIEELIALDAVWDLVGQGWLVGREAIMDACRATAVGIASVEVTWLRFVSTGPGPVVAVDAIGQYSGPEGVSVVSSCDIYDFDEGSITAITSYTVELPEAPAAHPSAVTATQ